VRLKEAQKREKKAAKPGFYPKSGGKRNPRTLKEALITKIEVT